MNCGEFLYYYNVLFFKPDSMAVHKKRVLIQMMIDCLRSHENSLKKKTSFRRRLLETETFLAMKEAEGKKN